MRNHPRVFIPFVIIVAFALPYIWQAFQFTDWLKIISAVILGWFVSAIAERWNIS